MPKGNLLSARPAGQQGTARYGSQPGGLNASLLNPPAKGLSKPDATRWKSTLGLNRQAPTRKPGQSPLDRMNGVDPVRDRTAIDRGLFGNTYSMAGPTTQRAAIPAHGQFGGDHVILNPTPSQASSPFFEPSQSPEHIRNAQIQQNRNLLEANPGGIMPGGGYIGMINGKDGEVPSLPIVGQGAGQPVRSREEFNRLFAQSQGSGLRAQQAELARRAAAQGGQPEGLLAGAPQPGQAQQGPQQPQGGLFDGMSPQQQMVVQNAMQRRQGRQNRLYGPDPQTLFAMNNPREFALLQQGQMQARNDAERNRGLLGLQGAQADLARAEAENIRGGNGPNDWQKFQVAGLSQALADGTITPEQYAEGIGNLQGGQAAGAPEGSLFGPAKKEELGGLVTSKQLETLNKLKQYPDEVVKYATGELGMTEQQANILLGRLYNSDDWYDNTRTTDDPTGKGSNWRRGGRVDPTTGILQKSWYDKLLGG